jgi:hypothetical protein
MTLRSPMRMKMVPGSGPFPYHTEAQKDFNIIVLGMPYRLSLAPHRENIPNLQFDK